ncbi:MAG TPA: metalloregulator ArsR/SmtB family transcription factor [Phycisphaerales bacterium]|nr:metalloregulator ArsR/SmtB family transcription factor [Phycisphaerales bacterium]
MKQVASSYPVSASLSALAEPVRLRILRVLEAEELSVGEVSRVTQLPQSTVSRHLKTLAEVGFVARRSVATATLYRLVPDDLDESLRPLWLAVRSQLGSLPHAQGDQRRLASVLAERRMDSKDFFGRVAGEWNEVRTTLFGTGFTSQALLSLLNPDWVVADLGCGSGDVARLLSPHVGRVIGVDQNEAMLDAARERLGSQYNIEFVAGDLESLPIPDASVDAAVLSLVLHHIEDPARVLKEVRRTLCRDQGGGVALIVDMLAHDRDEYRRTMGHQHLGFSSGDIRGYFGSAGFGEIRFHELPTQTDARGPGLFVASARIETGT